MTLSALVPATVQILCLMSRDPKPLVHIWSLHSLWLTVEAAGLTYVPHVQVFNPGVFYMKLVKTMGKMDRNL